MYREGVGVDNLLLAIAEQLKVPLTTIARQAELGQLTGQVGLTDASAIRSQAAAALSLVDSYLLGLELMQSQGKLELEPVSISSMLVDAAHELEHFALSHRVQLEVEVGGKFGPVMGNFRGLRAVLMSVGFELIEAQAAQDVSGPRRVVLATHRTSTGVVAGVYGRYDDRLRADDWRAALDMAGQVRQPFISAMAGNAAGLFVADTILRSMDTSLRVGKYRSRSGLAATFNPSQQLSFV